MGAGWDEGAVDVVVEEAGLNVAWAAYCMYESEIEPADLCALAPLLGSGQRDGSWYRNYIHMAPSTWVYSMVQPFHQSFPLLFSFIFL